MGKIEVQLYTDVKMNKDTGWKAEKDHSDELGLLSEERSQPFAESCASWRREVWDSR